MQCKSRCLIILLVLTAVNSASWSSWSHLAAQDYGYPQTDIRRLPAPYPHADSYGSGVTNPHLNFASAPLNSSDFLDDANGSPLAEPSYSTVGARLQDHKNGFFQKLSVSTAWLDRDSRSGFGLTEIESYVRFALPAPTTDSPLLITPAYNMFFVDGPRDRDFPEQLHEAYVDFTWVPKISENWTGIIGVAPSIYSDFETSASDSFRLTGTGLAKYNWQPERLELIFGVLYLNRKDIGILPAGGVIWTPNPDVRYEILFPQPKFAHRFACGPGFEDWVYLQGEFGGDSYAIERNGGISDTATLRDYRILFGVERKKNGGAGFRTEIGYVFNRSVEFESGIPDIEPDSTFLLRAGFTL